MSQAGSGGRLSIRVQIEGISEAESKLKSLQSTIESMGTKLTATASSMTKLPQSLNSLKSASDSTATSLQKLPGTITSLGSAATSGITNLNKLQSGITTLGATTTQVGNQMQQFSSRVQASMQAISSGSGLTGATGAIGALNTAMTSGAPIAQRYSTTMTSFGTSATGARTGLEGLTGSLDRQGQSVGRTAQETAHLASRMAGVGLSVTIMSSAIDEAVGMQSALQQAQKRVADEQENYNQKLAQFGEGSFQAEQALNKLEKAQNALTFATRNAGFAWRDIIPIAGLLVTQAIDPIMKAVEKMRTSGGLMNVFSGLETKMSGLGPKFASLGTAIASAFTPVARETSTAVTGLDAVSGAMGKTSQSAGILRTSIGGLTFGGFLGIIGAVATALALVATNTFGLRDSFNDLGEGIAEVIPQSEGFLTFLGKAVEGLGQLMGVQSEADKLWIANATKMAEANKLIAESLKDPLEAFQRFTDEVKLSASLKPLDQLFGGLDASKGLGGFGQVIADLEQMSFIFDNMATAGDKVTGVLSPVQESLGRIKEEVMAFGGEPAQRWNQAWAEAARLQQKYMEGGEPTVQELLKLKNMVTGLGHEINVGLVDPFQAAIESGDKWTVSGQLMTRDMEDMGGAMTELTNLTHVTGTTFMTESGSLVTFGENVTKTKEAIEETTPTYDDLLKKIEEGKKIMQDFIGDLPDQMFDYASAVRDAAEAESQHVIKLKEQAAGFGATAEEIQKMSEVGGLEGFNKSMADSKKEAEGLNTSMRGLAETLGMGKEAWSASTDAVMNWIGSHSEVATTQTEVNQAIIDSATALANDTKEKDLNAQATRAMIGSLLEQNNVYATLDENLANTEQALSRLNVELGTQEGQWLAYQNSIADADLKFATFLQTTRDSVVEQQRYKELLQGTGETFIGFPAFVQPTIDKFELMRAAQKGNIQAAEDLKTAMLEDWRTMASGADKVFGDLKAAWEDVFSGETLGKQRQTIQDMKDQLGEDMADLDQQLADVMNAEEFDGEEWQRITNEMSSTWAQGIADINQASSTMTDPISEVFNNLPQVVQAGLSDAERQMLSVQAKFAVVGEQAGMAFGLEMNANMGSGMDQAVAMAAQRALEILEPFKAEHPEMASYVDPLINALRTGTPEAIQAALNEMGKFPGPAKEIGDRVAAGLSAMGVELPGAAKTGVEGALQELGGLQTGIGDKIKSAIDALNLTIANEFEKLIKVINKAINDDIKQDPDKIPLVTVDANPANKQIQLIGQSLDQLRTYLFDNPITLVAIDANPLEKQVQSIGDTVGTVASFLFDNKITLVAIERNPLEKQVQLAATALSQLQTYLQQNLISMLAPEINPLEGQVQSSVSAVQQTQQYLQQNPIAMVGAEINPVAGQVQSAVDAHQQLQQYFNQNPLVMQVQQPPGMAPQSQGSYLGAYGPPNQSYYNNPAGAAYPSMFGAQGIAPQLITKPTMMLVAEAGPELVSVTPQNKIGKAGGVIMAQAGFGGQQYQFGQNYGYNGPGLWQTDAEEEAYKQQVKAAMQQGTEQGAQNGIEEGMRDATAPGGALSQPGGGVPEGYPMANYGMGPGGAPAGWGAGVQSWYGPGGGGLGYPGMQSRGIWTGGAMGTTIGGGMGGFGGGGAGQAMYPQIQYGEAQAKAISQGFQRGMAGQSQVWVNQGLKAGQSMGTGTLMGYEEFMRSQQGEFNQIPSQIFRGFPAGAATFGGLMGDAMMERFNRELQDSIAQMPPMLYDQWGRRYDQAGAGGGIGGGGAGGGGAPRNVSPPPNQNLPAYTGSQIPKGVTTSQTINGVRATILPGQYIGTGTWPPQQPGGGGTGGGGLPPPTGGGGGMPGGGGGMPGGGGAGGYPVAPSNTEIFGHPQTYKWYGPGDPRNTISAQGGFHGVIDRAMTLNVHPNERVDVSPGPRPSNGHGEGCNHFHIYIGNEKIKEIIRKTAGTQMDRFIR
jgi:hypothetical protein